VAEKPRPPSEAGAALLELLERNLLPGLCWAAEDAILLAPYRVDAGHWGGFLVAQVSAAGQAREFASEAGEVVALRVPADAVQGRAFAAAQAGAVLAMSSREN
jgi:hypothetical protein